MRALLLAIAISLTGLVVGACDKGTPVTPAGATLLVTANPAQIAVEGTSTITVTALRSNGTPVNPGTEIRLDTNLGTVPAIVTTDDRGFATAILRGDGRSGTAKVTARSGVATAATVDVKVGAKVDKVTLQPTPTSIDTSATRIVSLLAVVRDDQGQPVPGVGVTFGTEAGKLASLGAIILTNSRGEATDDLTVRPGDASTQTDGMIAVTATATGGGGTATATAQVLLHGS
ncbi:MAG TPA: invasin domain 3-containing protein [Thermoanaerobaculia bacterium]|jgi:hypothetical protein|nr:invasin domain 3-containing protein [Thermoanaerobaculia bacterium]